MTLHEAMEKALGTETLAMSDLAARIRKQGLYRQKNGDFPDEKQLALRALKEEYRDRFGVLIRRK